PGAVAKEYAGAAVVPVEDARENLGADHQGFFVNTTSDKAVGGGERVDEAAAYGLHVERRASFNTELGLQQAGGARENIVRRGRRHDDQIEIGRLRASGLQGPYRSMESEVARTLRL